jgi:transcriptional regulator of acetoin/glycerol metabolism
VFAQVLKITGEALASSRYAPQGKLLRAMVHLRPDDGYRGLVVLEDGAKVAELVVGRSAAESSASYLPSASAWRWVAEHRSAVAIDVSMGRVQPTAAGSGGSIVEKTDRSEGIWGRESAERLLGRSSTHLYVLPLRTRGVIAGMITLEANCRSAIGREFIWPQLREPLEMFAGIAAPYLFALPPAPVGASLTDALLPVVGASSAGLVQLARIFARQDETILISGPTGAGKSRLARWCHEQSRRRAHGFEVIDLMAIPDELQMGELFGWKKGAFSGAVTDNPGCISRAEGGTLFIDEIDKLSLKAQAGLLHVLEERRYRLLGEGSSERKANVRFLVGTNASLEEAVRAGRFREDLYYRINVLPLRLAPLDERTDEIPLWAQYMVTRRHRETDPAGHASISTPAVRVLELRKWPGNLRQLDNVLRRAYALALAEHEAISSEVEVVVEERHVERALGYEQSGGAESIPRLMHRMAGAFVQEAERRAE